MLNSPQRNTGMPNGPYLVVSYKENGTEYWGYGGQEDYNGAFHQMICINENEIIDWVVQLEREDVDEPSSYTHYIHTPDTIKNAEVEPEIPHNLMEIVRNEVKRIVLREKREKEIKAIEKAKEESRIKEEKERKEHLRLKEKFDGKD